MHIADKGEEGNPVVLFLHGFPELWYSWRHQILSLSAHGYRAIAPDLRGFGDTDAPPSSESYTVFHIVGDLIALIDTLGLQQVFVVGHDWGAVIAWYFCLFRPDRVKALVNLSVPFRPRHPSRKPVASMRAMFGEDYYICRFQLKVPVKFIVGDEDRTYTTPGAKEYIHGSGFKKDVPFLQELVVMKGVAHFLTSMTLSESSSLLLVAWCCILVAHQDSV